MIPAEADKLMAHFLAIWPTPRMTDDTMALWLGRFKSLDVDTVKAALGHLERTEKHRPAASDFYQAVSSTARGETGGNRSDFFALAWRSDSTGHGETIVSPVQHTQAHLTVWITEFVRAHGDEWEINPYRREFTGGQFFVDHPLTETGPAVKRQLPLPDVRLDAALARDPSGPNRDDDEF